MSRSILLSVIRSLTMFLVKLNRLRIKFLRNNVLIFVYIFKNIIKQGEIFQLQWNTSGLKCIRLLQPKNSL